MIQMGDTRPVAQADGRGFSKLVMEESGGESRPPVVSTRMENRHPVAVIHWEASYLTALQMSAFTRTVEVVEIVNSVAGIVLNALLLIAIGRFSPNYLGTYKYLLTIFAFLDGYLAIIHVIVHPRVLRVGNIHSVVSDTIIDDRKVTAFWIGCQSMPFTLLVIHFLYRYWSVRRPHLIVLFSKKFFVSLLVFVTLGVLVSWISMCLLSTSGHDNKVALEIMIAEYESKYGKRIENAWILMEHWHDNQFDIILIAITLVMNAIMLCSVALSSLFAILTFRSIRSLYKTSFQFSKLQKQLLFALCAQSAIPILFVYWPYLICINAPFLHISGTVFHDICSPVFTFFPVWDAVIVICLFSDFRKGLFGIVRQLNVVAPTTQVTPVTQPQISVIPSMIKIIPLRFLIPTKPENNEKNVKAMAKINKLFNTTAAVPSVHTNPRWILSAMVSDLSGDE
ncbi:hypothetical protein PRIPAC_95543 [Pristionchus pacificus]|uniref:G protein-coupled receptor n=1 Tax=Pristionchus pacificus TaxID=54126 RepID=A0A2A6D360_PRIPA|nr:hypothetical protein PRIPAC_95543 [Pristionchus pacificus]|eukprot:PDM84776.1 G protein-coupled receptor [Pristionchus pacificus]